MKYKFTKTLVVAMAVLLLGACGGSGGGGDDTADTVKPVVTELALNGVEAQLSVFQNIPVTITAIAKDNIAVTEVNVWINGVEGEKMTLTADANKYSYEYASAEAGEFEVKVVAKDAAGNIGSSDELMLYVSEVILPDDEKPVVTDFTLSNTKVNPGTDVVATVAVTDNDEIVLVEIFRDANIYVGEMEKISEGRYSFTLKNLEVGVYQYEVRAIDAYNNIGKSASMLTLTVEKEIVKDTEAPIVSNFVLNPNKVFKGMPVIITVTATDNVGVTVVTLKEGLSTIGTFASAGGNNYTYTLATPKAGTFALQVEARDAANQAGTSGQLVLTVEEVPFVDDVPPVVGALSFSGNNVDKGTKVIVSVVVTDNVGVERVELKVAGKLVGNMAPIGSNNYTYTVDTPNAGDFSIQAIAYDLIGNPATSTPKTLTVKTPEVVDSEPPVLGALSANKTTVDKGTPVVLTITATDNVGVALVDLYVNNVNAGSFTANGGINYTYTYNTTAIGPFSLQVRAEDAVGQTAISNTINLIVNEVEEEDKTPPTVGVLTLSETTVTQDTPVTVTIIVTDDVAMGTVELRVGGVSKGNMTLTTGNTYSYTLATPTDGDFQLQVFATDAAGNVALSGAATLTVNKQVGDDTTPPTVSAFNLNPAVVTKGTSVTVTVNATDENGIASVELYVDGAVKGNMNLTSGSTYSYTLATPNEGTFELKAFAKDAAGNSAWSDAKSLKVNNGEGPDTEKPTVGALTMSNNNPKVGDAVVVTVVAMDNVAVTGVDFYVDGAKKGAFTKGAGSNWTISWNTTGLAAKTYALKAIGTDAAGNTGEGIVRDQLLKPASNFVSPPPGYSQVANFGEGPYISGIKMNLHIPADVPENAPVVIAMHGCSQASPAFKTDTGWTTLADKYKFYVIFPEMNKSQNDSNQAGNSYGCFNWAGYYGRNFGRNLGDSASLLQMVKYVQNKYSAGKAYATGLSAGGGMAAALGAFYPDEFDAIAPLAGPVFGCAVFDSTGKKLPTTAKAVEQAAYDCMGITSSFTPRSGSVANMNPNKNRTGDMWAKHVRDSGPAGYTGPYPRVFSWIGTKDQLVDPVHNNLHVQQWTRLHGIDETADNADKKFKTGSGVRDHVYNEYQDESGKPLVKTLLITNMGHGIAVDPGTGEDQGGTGAAADCYGLFCSWKTAVGIHSSYYSAKFFGILDGGDTPDDGTAKVTITAPAAGSSVAENAVVKIEATAIDETTEKVGINNVEFYVDGARLCVDTSAPYNCDWNTTGIAKGKKVNIEVIAYNNIVFTSGKKAIDVYVGQPDFTCKDYPGSLYQHRTATPPRATMVGTCTFTTPECLYTLTGSNEEVKVSGSVAGSGSTPLKETSAGYFESGTCN